MFTSTSSPISHTHSSLRQYGLPCLPTPPKALVDPFRAPSVVGSLRNARGRAKIDYGMEDVGERFGLRQSLVLELRYEMGINFTVPIGAIDEEGDHDGP